MIDIGSLVSMLQLPPPAQAVAASYVEGDFIAVLAQAGQNAATPLHALADSARLVAAPQPGVTLNAAPASPVAPPLVQWAPLVTPQATDKQVTGTKPSADRGDAALLPAPLVLVVPHQVVTTERDQPVGPPLTSANEEEQGGENLPMDASLLTDRPPLQREAKSGVTADGRESMAMANRWLGWKAGEPDRVPAQGPAVIEAQPHDGTTNEYIIDPVPIAEGVQAQAACQVAVTAAMDAGAARVTEATAERPQPENVPAQPSRQRPHGAVTMQTIQTSSAAATAALEAHEGDGGLKALIQQVGRLERATRDIGETGRLDQKETGPDALVKVSQPAAPSRETKVAGVVPMANPAAAPFPNGSMIVLASEASADAAVGYRTELPTAPAGEGPAQAVDTLQPARKKVETARGVETTIERLSQKLDQLRAAGALPAMAVESTRVALDQARQVVRQVSLSPSKGSSSLPSIERIKSAVRLVGECLSRIETKGDSKSVSEVAAAVQVGGETESEAVTTAATARPHAQAVDESETEAVTTADATLPGVRAADETETDAATTAKTALPHIQVVDQTEREAVTTAKTVLPYVQMPRAESTAAAAPGREAVTTAKTVLPYVQMPRPESAAAAAPSLDRVAVGLEKMTRSATAVQRVHSPMPRAQAEPQTPPGAEEPKVAAGAAAAQVAAAAGDETKAAGAPFQKHQPAAPPAEQAAVKTEKPTARVSPDATPSSHRPHAVAAAQQAGASEGAAPVETPSVLHVIPMARVQTTSDPAPVAPAQPAVEARAPEEIVKHAILTVRGGQSSLDIQLQPEELGRLRVHVVQASGEIQIRMSADQPQGRQFIERNLDQIRQGFADGNFGSVKLEIANTTGPRNDLMGNQSQWQQGGTSHHGRWEPQGPSFSVRDPEPSMAAPTDRGTESRPDSLVDVLG